MLSRVSIRAAALLTLLVASGCVTRPPTIAHVHVGHALSGVHVTPGQGTDIGAGATVGHNCTVHAATLGEECLVGNGSTILDGARVGVRAMVAAGALVAPGTEIPDGMLALGTPARVRGPLAGTPAERWVRVNPEAYQALAQRHKASVAPVSSE